MSKLTSGPPDLSDLGSSRLGEVVCCFELVDCKPGTPASEPESSNLTVTSKRGPELHSLRMLSLSPVVGEACELLLNPNEVEISSGLCWWPSHEADEAIVSF